MELGTTTIEVLAAIESSGGGVGAVEIQSIIASRRGKDINPGSISNATKTLRREQLVRWILRGRPGRGGRPTKVYWLTDAGREVLEQYRLRLVNGGG